METKENRPTTAAPGNGAPRNTMSGTSPQTALRSKLRGADFAEGEAMLAPVQRQEAKGQPPDSEALLRAEVDRLKLESRERAYASVSRDLDTVERELPTAKISLNRVEAYIDDAICNDAAQRDAGEAYEKATDAYLKSKEPNWIDAVSAILDVGAAIKSLVKVGQSVVALKKAGDLRKAAKLVEPAIDGVLGSQAFTKGVAAGAKMPSQGAGDETSAMVGSVDAEVKVLLARVALLETFTLGASQASLMTSMNVMSTSVDRVFDELPFIGTSTPEYIASAARADDVVGDLSAFADDLDGRMRHLQSLIAARGAGGGAAIVPGSAERALFEELLRDEALRSRALLTVEQWLEVDCHDRNNLVEQTKPTRFSLSVGDEKKHAEWAKTLRPLPEAVTVEVFKSRRDLTIPESMSRALASLGIPKAVIPPATVYLHGGEINRTMGLAEFRADPDAAWRRTRDVTYPDYR